MSIQADNINGNVLLKRVEPLTIFCHVRLQSLPIGHITKYAKYLYALPCLGTTSNSLVLSRALNRGDRAATLSTCWFTYQETSLLMQLVMEVMAMPLVLSTIVDLPPCDRCHTSGWGGVMTPPVGCTDHECDIHMVLTLNDGLVLFC